MIRVFRLALLLLVAPVSLIALILPAGAADLPYFAGGELPSLKATGSPDYDPAPSNPWTGLTMGAGVFGVSGSGRGSRGGFGGDTFIGYNHEFDNRVVVGVQGSVGLCRASINMAQAAIISAWPISRSAMTWAASCLT